MRILLVAACFFPALILQAQNPKDHRNIPVQAHTFIPGEQKPGADFVQSLQVPEGFTVSVFAEGLENPRMLAFGNNGHLYVTLKKPGKVVLLRDRNNTGRAAEKIEIATGLKDVHGITVHQGKLYLCTPTELYSATILNSGNINRPQKIIDNLPDGGQHPNRTIAFGPDGKLYISVGSTCNACNEPNPEHATMLQMNANGSARRVFAKGLRNTVGFDWHPQTRALWGWDHGSDMRGDDIPPEELNLIEEGKNYGWPFVYGNRIIDSLIPGAPDDLPVETFALRSEPPVLEYTAHSAPMAFLFYKGNAFPETYRNSAFVAFRGSWNRNPPSGYKIAHVRFENGQPAEVRDFVTGFISADGSRQFGRLAGMAVGPDGSLYFSDDHNGIIYRVSYRGSN